MYDVLYHYSSPSFNLIEIQRLDLPESAPKDKVYHWLKISHGTEVVQKLTFQGMDEASRTFSEGVLDLRGIFQGVELKKIESGVLDQRLDKIVRAFIK